MMVVLNKFLGFGQGWRLRQFSYLSVKKMGLSRESNMFTRVGGIDTQCFGWFASVLVTQFQGRHHIITYQHFAGMRDMFSSWFSTLLYSWYYRDKYDMVDLYSHVQQYILAGASLI